MPNYPLSRQQVTPRHRELTRQAWIQRFGVLLAAIGLLASACGGASGGAIATADPDTADTSTADSGPPEAAAGDEGAAQPDPDTAQPNDSAAPSDTVASGGTSMAASSPIGAFFDGGFDEALVEYTTRVEEAILLCMAAQGFEFAVTGDGRVNEVEARQNDLTTREWTAQYGFGISTSFDSIVQDQTSDPNVAIFFSMSESEREVWSQTLSGGDIGAAAGGDFGSRPLEEQGCVGQALIETGGQEAIEGLETFGNVYEEGQAGLLDTREMVAAVDAWSRCMGEAGYPAMSALDDPEDEIGDRLLAVTVPMSAALQDLSDEEGQALTAGDSVDLEQLPDLDVQALRDLQDDERALALADLDCYEAEVQVTYDPLLNAFEQGLLVDYATELNALKNIGS